MNAQKFSNRSLINYVVAYTDIRESYIFIPWKNSIYMVLSALMLILFDFSHLSRHFSSLLISSAESITLSCTGTQVESVVSSAWRMYLNWSEHFVISFMKIKNRRGPKIDICGTPHWIIIGFESTLFIDTYCFLFVRYERNQYKAIQMMNFLLAYCF